MSFSKLFLILLLASLSVHARLIDELEGLCETPEVQSIKGENGSCRIFISPDLPQTESGVCKGKVSEEHQCQISYNFHETSASFTLLCPTIGINSTITSTVDSYQVGAVITEESGKKHLYKDSTKHRMIENDAFLFTVADKSSVEKRDLTARFIVIGDDGNVELSDVTCE